MDNTTAKCQFVVCIKNDNYPASLELRNIYCVMPDLDVSDNAYLRVIDESGEDYLYPADYLVPIQLPKAAEKAFAISS